MTGNASTDEKIRNLPTMPTDTDATSRGDAIIEIRDDSDLVPRVSSQYTRSSVNVGSAQPQTNKKRSHVLQRITGSFKPQSDPIDVTETRTRDLENTPNGFPRLAAFQSSDINFSLYRSFRYLHSRVLLDLQDEITSLEKQLDYMDEEDHEDDPARLQSRYVDIDRAVRDGRSPNRPEILRKIRAKLLDYDEILIKARQLESFQKPSERNYRSVRNYYHNNKPLMDSETDSIRTKDDIVSLRNGRE
ncbi:hypothetical protein CC86DRAFT_369704 [Ophiobolus disseminans]|uniref:DUF6594 domain-containing protein n=1 Tax=Ophiobolus disseminans TaxID=1469910 RepID=A0A6A7A3B1_9PLEO|nr:hypothetical protein CC86DRAFT_369704 [Ophiobolus disseminans]